MHDQPRVTGKGWRLRDCDHAWQFDKWGMAESSAARSVVWLAVIVLTMMRRGLLAIVVMIVRHLRRVRAARGDLVIGRRRGVVVMPPGCGCHRGLGFQRRDCEKQHHRPGDEIPSDRFCATKNHIKELPDPGGAFKTTS
jgi:hypothetical protein